MSASKNRLSTGRKLAFSVATTLIFLVSSEVIVRGWVYYLREPYERFDSTTDTFILIPGSHRSVGHQVIVNTDGFVGKELEVEGADLWRIAAVGDSNTFGDGDDRNTYPAKFEQRLDARAPTARRYEVINAGIQGLDSGLALRRLATKVTPVRPNVVTIYIGWNDLMKFDPLGQVVETRLSSASRFVDSLWIVKGMRKLLFFYLRNRIDPPATGPESGTGRFKDFKPTIFESNVNAMLELVRRSGAIPLLITLPTVVRRDMTIADVRAAAVYFPYYRSAYGVVDLADLVDSYNRTIRGIAADEQVGLVDLAALFASRSDYRSLFYDTMHPTSKGQDLIADHLVSRFGELGLLGDKAVGRP